MTPEITVQVSLLKKWCKPLIEEIQGTGREVEPHQWDWLAASCAVVWSLQAHGIKVDWSHPLGSDPNDIWLYEKDGGKERTFCVHVVYEDVKTVPLTEDTDGIVVVNAHQDTYEIVGYASKKTNGNVKPINMKYPGMAFGMLWQIVNEANEDDETDPLGIF